MTITNAGQLLAEMPKNFDDLYWNQKKEYALRVVLRCRNMGFEDEDQATIPAWERANPQRYPFSLPRLARFIAAQTDASLQELYQYVSRVYANSMYNIQNDTIQTIIDYHMQEPGGLPNLFWEGFVRDVDVRTLARLGRELPTEHVGPVLARLFQHDHDRRWGQPYLHLYHLYLTQRTDEFGVVTWDYLEALYKPEDADSLA